MAFYFPDPNMICLKHSISPVYTEPKEVGNFSINGNREYSHGDESLKYLSFEALKSNVKDFDLNAGYECSIKMDYSIDDGLEFLLKWCSEHPGSLEGVEFITRRDELIEIMKSPYNFSSDWRIGASKFRGVIYIRKFRTQRENEAILRETDRCHLQSYWGVKYEYYMTTDTPGGLPRYPNEPINTNEAFYSVVRSSLARHSLLFSAEIDALDQDIQDHHAQIAGKTDKYVELKTNALVNWRNIFSFRSKKLLYLWAQAFLLGTKDNFIGFRDNDGVVKLVELYETEEIPAIANKKEDLWSPEACLDSLEKFLNFVKATLIDDNPNVVYTFYWKNGQPIIPWRIENESEYIVLPKWYIEKLQE